MTAPALPELEHNGGLPEPAPNAPVRVVAAVHPGCGSATGMRLPAVLPSRAVRRVRCSGCHQTYDCRALIELGGGPQEGSRRDSHRGDGARTSAAAAGAAPAAGGVDSGTRGRLRLPGRSRKTGDGSEDGGRRRLLGPPSGDRRERILRLAIVPLAAAAVIAVLLALRGPAGSGAPAGGERNGGSAAPVSAGKALQKAGEDARMVRGAAFSLALPPGWKQIEPGAGAGFAAVAEGREADATLWIERDPKLDLAEFEQRSLDRLEQLAGSAQVVERVDAPTEEASSVRLAADAPADAPAYEVLLRADGPYRYYLATTLQPGAAKSTAEDIALIQGSFVPTPSVGGSEG